MVRAFWPNGSTRIPAVTDEYGWREAHPITGVRAFHYGIDLVGFPVNLSPVNGQIVYARYNGGAGNQVTVRSSETGHDFIIKHNANFLVTEGQFVHAGDALGVMGTTGASTGVHCHFEIWVNGSSVNPRNYMADVSGAGLNVTPIDEGDDDVTDVIYWICNATSLDGEFVNGKRYRQEGMTGFPFPYPLSDSTVTAMNEQNGGLKDAKETPINGNDLSKIAAKIRSAYPAAGGVPVIDYTKLNLPTAEQIAALVKVPTAAEVALEIAKRLGNG